MKKYIFLIPLLTVMLLNCITFGQVLAVDSPTIYDSSYISSYMEYWDFDIVEPIVNEAASVRYPDSQIKSDYYFYSVGSTVFPTFDSDSVTGGSLSDYLFYFDSCDAVKEDENYISFKIQSYYMYKFDVKDSEAILADSGNLGVNWYHESVRNYLIYDKKKGLFSISSSPEFNRKYCECVFYQCTNIPDFPFADGISKPDGNELKVDVNINPAFSGEFDRKYKNNSSTLTYENFTLTVSNNSSFPIQYAMFIVGYDETVDFVPKLFDNNYSDGKGFYGNPAFAYLSDEWAYMPKFAGLSDNPFGSSNTGIVRTYKPCAWHYLSEKDVFTTTISYSQMKLIKDKNYNVYVYAVRNDKDAVCLISPVQTVHGGYNEEYSIDLTESEIVYTSSFVCRNPAEFDSDNNSNGTYAYNSDDDEIYRRATAYVDDNGEVKLEKVDTNAFLSPSGDYSGTAWNNSNKNTVSGDIGQLSANFASFYKFVVSVLGYFPKNFQSVFSLGFVSVVVLGIVKVVFR